MGFYQNLCVLEPLGHELRTNMKTNALKTVLIIFKFSIICGLISSHKITKMHKVI
jgi:hypothetical protein